MRRGWVNAIAAPLDVTLALVAFGLMMFWKLPPWWCSQVQAALL